MKNSRITIKTIITGILITLFIFICFVCEVKAQWIDQTIILEPGWNAVYLEIEPQPNQCDEVFKDLPIASVWAWNPKVSTVEYIKNPSTLLPNEPQWMVYFPPSSPENVLTRLFIVQGGRAYLIKLEGAQPVEWTIRGRPCMPGITWKSNSYNFVGFHLTQGDEPFMGLFFSYSTSHAGQDIYRLDENDNWKKVQYPSITPMKQGEAYWVYCKGPSNFVGPIKCQVEQGKGLDYGRTLLEQEFRIRNLLNNQTNITLEAFSSLDPPDMTQPQVAGDVPLLYWNFALGGWTPLPAAFSLTVEAGQEKILRLAVKRSAMFTTGLCQSILEVKNDVGNRILIPVTASGSGLSDGMELARKRDAAESRYAGLWIGSVLINGVSQPTAHSNPDDPGKSTASEFQFRLIVHVDAGGQARLLKEVIQMWADGTWKEDPNAPGRQIVDEPGHFVLLTDDSLIPQYSGAGLRSGESIGRRISSAAFSFSNPIALEGSFSSTGGLSCPIMVNSDDPLNPFKHTYHPDHDNLDEYWENYKKEAFEVKRDIELEFTSLDPMILEKSEDPANTEAAQSAGWGDTDMGGIYRETFTGLHKRQIYAKGFFYLHKVSPVALLNDGRPLN